MEKRHFVVIGAVFVVLLTLLFLFRPKPVGTPDEQTNLGSGSEQGGNDMGHGLVAKIGSLSGTVTIQSSGSSTVPAILNQEIRTGDTIRTGRDGQVSIEFYSSDRTALDANSILVIEEIMVESDWRKQHVHLNLQAGRMWSRILRLLDVESHYEVGSSGIVTNVRGTAYALTTRGTTVRFDEFDGSLSLDGLIKGVLDEGFSTTLDTKRLPTDFATAVMFTPDEVRNDHWIRAQLRADEEFAKRAAQVRNKLGANESAQGIGQEAGPFTLDQPGVVHSNFTAVSISAENQPATVKPGSSLPLHALAVFTEPKGVTNKDVTTEATWHVLDETQGTIDKNGVFQSSPKAQSGKVEIMARWNDGTHEHSGTFSLLIAGDGATIIETKSTLEIKP